LRIRVSRRGLSSRRLKPDGNASLQLTSSTYRQFHNLSRRGEKVSDDEERAPKKGKIKSQEDRSETWKKAPRKSKAKVKHLTYEEILAEGDESPGPATSLGQIIDATGATVRTAPLLHTKLSLIGLPICLIAQRSRITS
jgi:hypothetical protein